jgi:hypothetical protein
VTATRVFFFTMRTSHFLGNAFTNFSAHSIQRFNCSSSWTPSYSISTQPFIGLPVMSNSRTCGSKKCVVVVVGTKACYQRVLPNADEYVAVEQETDAAEHLLFFDATLPGKGVKDTGSEGFVESHSSLLLVLSRFLLTATDAKTVRTLKRTRVFVGATTTSPHFRIKSLSRSYNSITSCGLPSRSCSTVNWSHE